MGGEKAAPSPDDERQRAGDEHGDAAADDGEAQTPPPVFQSRLRAKREERLQQRQLELELELLNAPATVAPHVLEIDLNAVARSIRSTVTVVDSRDDAALKRRERAEARKRVIDYQGSIWDAVRTNDLAMLRNYFLVEGAQTLLRRRHPDAEQGGRSLLHYTAFHWAGRRGHGTVLLQMALELERLEGGSTPALWVMKPSDMDGFMRTVSPDERHHLSKKKQEWRTLFLKLDDISARLIAFSDRSQFQVCWSVQLAGADISTPVPGEPNYGIDVDDTPFCFYVRETSVAKDCVHFLSASDGATKKAWMKALTQIARDGPRAPRFTVSQAESEFEFHARVAKFRPHVDGTHAVRFDELNESVDPFVKLKKSLGPQMEGLGIVKHKRDAFRSVLGKAFDQEFLEERRVLLDSFVAGVCKIRTAVDFFKHHSDPHLKVRKALQSTTTPCTRSFSRFPTVH
ncbi:hypothetical protein BBJ28_00006745 [Nothophytophthora sp. Chile5]|nr:hypothetical protein BBJ28_00006745 [Nothophytophthora sp. Chile5]